MVEQPPFPPLIQVPPRLSSVAALLCSMEPDRQRVPYRAATWRRHLGDNDPDLAALTAEHPGRLTRGDLRELSRLAHGDSALRRRLFLATMIWGYGTVGRGPWRVARMLADPRLDAALDQAFTAVGAGDLLSAYQNFIVAWCGPAFLTKFLYAVGLGCGADPLPLVLDARVARSLQVLAGDGSLRFADFVTLGAGDTVAWNPAGWVRFVEAANQWASVLGCHPDAIEMLMFESPSLFTQFCPPLAPPSA